VLLLHKETHTEGYEVNHEFDHKQSTLLRTMVF